MITKFGLKYSIGAILKRGPIAFKRRIHNVLIGVTYNCQCNCAHCAMAKYDRKGKELSTDEIKDLIDQLFLLNVRIIEFFGGEPLLRKDIFELIEYTSPKMLTHIATNGILLTKKNVKKLKKVGLHILQVSVDSPNTEIHDKHRRKQCFKKAIKGLELAKKAKIPYILMSSYASKESIANGELDELIKLGKKIGINEFKTIEPVRAGKLINKNRQLLELGEKKLLELAKDPFVTLESNICLTHEKRAFYISPYGEVQPCCFIPLSLGNVRDEPVKCIVDRMWKHKMFDVKREQNKCMMNNEEFRKNYLKKGDDSYKKL